MPTDEQRDGRWSGSTQHRAAWGRTAALRALYAELVRAHRGGAAGRPSWGRAWSSARAPASRAIQSRSCILTDVVAAPWHDREIDAEAIPFPDGGVGALVLFDVLHHLPSPRRFFAEAARVLRARRAHRAVRAVHRAAVVPGVQVPARGAGRPDGRSAGADRRRGAGVRVGVASGADERIPSIRTRPSRRCCSAAAGGAPSSASSRRWRSKPVERLAGPSYPASGGFSHAPFLPAPLWSALHALERRLPAALFRLIGFRLLAVLERR